MAGLLSFMNPCAFTRALVLGSSPLTRIYSSVILASFTICVHFSISAGIKGCEFVRRGRLRCGPSAISALASSGSNGCCELTQVGQRPATTHPGEKPTWQACCTAIGGTSAQLSLSGQPAVCANYASTEGKCSDN